MVFNAKKDGIYYMLHHRGSWIVLEYNEVDCFSSKKEITELLY